MLNFRRLANRLFRSSIGRFALLAIGMGATATAFGMSNATLPGRPPSQRSEPLFYLHMPAGAPYGATSTGDDTTSFSLPVFEALRQDRRAFSEVMAYAPLGQDKVAVQAGDQSEEATGEMVSANFFSGLGVKMTVGRGFKMEDESRHTPFVVLSFAYWTHLFRRNPWVPGQVIYIHGVPFAVLAVAAEGFSGVEPEHPTDFWIPLQSRPELTPWGVSSKEQMLYGSPNWWCLRLIARLAPGMDAQRAVMEAMPQFQAAAYAGLAPSPEHQKAVFSLVPATGIGGISEDSRDWMPMLVAMAALLLLMACGFVAMRIRARKIARRPAQRSAGARLS